MPGSTTDPVNANVADQVYARLMARNKLARRKLLESLPPDQRRVMQGRFETADELSDQPFKVRPE